MAVNVIYTKVLELLKRAGIDPQKFIGTIDPNKIKKLTTKTEKTATRPKLIDALNKDKATFGDALKIFENEAKYISQMNEMELTNFANNLQDYFTVGGKVKYTPSNVVTTEGTPVVGKKLEKISERKGAKEKIEATSLQGSMEGLMSLVDELKGISPKMRNQMNRDELAKFLQKMRGRKFTNDEIKLVREYMDEWGIGLAKEKGAPAMEYAKKLGAKNKEEFQFIEEYLDNIQTTSPKDFRETFDVKKINMDLSDVIERKLEKHFKKKYKWDDTKRDGGLDDITYEKYEDEVYEAGKDFSDFHRVYDTDVEPGMFGRRKYQSWSNNPKNWLDEASEKLESITGEGLNVEFYKKYTDDVLTKYPKPEKFQYGGPVIKGPDMGATAHGSGELLARSRMFQPGGQTTTSTGLNYLLGEDDATRIPFQDGLSTNKINLDEIVGNVIGEREPPQLRAELTGLMGGPQGAMRDPRGIKSISSGAIKENAHNILRGMLYVAKNSDKKKQTSIYSGLDGGIELAITNNATGVETDAAEKFNWKLPTRIDENTVFDLTIDTFNKLPADLQAEIKASTNLAKDESWSALLEGTNLGIAYNSDNQKIEGYYDVNIDSETYLPTKITPKFEKNNITNENIASLFIGQGDFPPQRSDFPEGQMGSIMFAESLQAWQKNEDKRYWGIDLVSKPTSDYEGIRGTFTTENVSGWSAIERGDDTDVTKTQITGTIPNYFLKDQEPIELSGSYYQDLDTDDKEKKWRVDVPFPMGITPYYGQTLGDWENINEYGINLDKSGKVGNWDYNLTGNIDQDKDYLLKGNIGTDNVGIGGWFDADGNWHAGVQAKWQWGEPDKKKYESFTTSDPEEAWKYTKKKLFADGGIARLGFAGGKFVDASRRGFLKFLGGTAASIAALKTGLVKLMGGKNANEVKKVIDEVVVNNKTGAPDWFQSLVNKILREGKDANLTYGERQIGKTMDTPSGKVDVVYKMDTGDIELSFVGKNTALGEQVDLVYKPGQVIEEGKYAGKKEGDQFTAMESVPEGHMHGPDDYSIDIGYREADNVGDLSSDLSELKTFATGEKTTIKEIVEGIKKKKERVKMEEDPGQWLTDVHGDYDPYASGGLARLLGE